MPVYMYLYFSTPCPDCFQEGEWAMMPMIPGSVGLLVCKDKKTPLHIECNGFNLFLNNVNVMFNRSLFNSEFIFQFLGKCVFMNHNGSCFVGYERIRSI